MKISLGDFGNRVAAPERSIAAPSGAFGGQEAQALQQVGSAIGGIGQELKQQRDALDRSQGTAALASLNNDMHDISTDISRKISDGTLSPDEAKSTYQQQVNDAKASRFQGLQPHVQNALNSHVISASGALERNIDETIYQRGQSDIRANIMTTGESLQRSAMRDLPGAIDKYNVTLDATGPAAGYSPEQIAKQKQSFAEGSTFNFANATLEGAAQTGDIGMVRAAREKIQGKDGDMIDPAKRTMLVTKAYGYENGMLAQQQRDADKAQREQEARENQATDVYNKNFDLVSQGRYLSTEAINDLAAATAGTKMAGPTQELVKSQQKVAGFASLPLTQQAAAVERMRAAGSDPAVGVTPQEQKTNEQFQKIYDAGVKDYAENPWEAAQSRGVIMDAPVVNLADMQTAQQVLAGRMKNIGVVEVAAGRKISPLQPEEADQIARTVRSLPPDQQSSALASIGTIVNDSDRLADLAKQMHDKDQTLGLAMMLAGDKTTLGRYSSELLIRGDRALKDKAIQVDSQKETGWRGAISKEIGDAFPNQEVRQQVLDSAYLINAGLVADGQGSDTSRSIRLAVGSIVDHNGSKIPLPRGMQESDFNKRLSAITPADIARQTTDNNVYSGRQAIPVDQFIKQLPNASLIHAGPGRYNVKAGGSLITNSYGQRVTIKVTP